jgi:hypothetical protein
LVGKPEGKRSSVKWEDNIKRALEKYGVRRLNYLTWLKVGEDKLCAFVKNVMNFRVS